MKIFINTRPGIIGGPGIFVKNFVEEISKRGGHKITYDLTPDCNVALFLVSVSDGQLKFCKEHKIKTVGRLDGFYIPEYWHNQTPDRRMTIDKVQTNNQMRQNIPKYDIVIYQSNWSKEMFDKWIHKRVDAHVVYNGVDSNKFRNMNPGKRTNCVLMLGALRHKYMMNTFFGAYEKCKGKVSGMTWLVAGSMDQECKQIFNKNVKNKNVKYLGQIDHNNLPQIYNKADIFFHPRAGDSCPNVILEAMACGLAIVCPSWGGSSELVGRGGVIVETDKWSYGQKYNGDCGIAIKQAFNNLALHEFKARVRIEKHFTIKCMVDKYLELMQ